MISSLRMLNHFKGLLAVLLLLAAGSTAAAQSCSSISLSPASASVAGGGGTGSFTVTTTPASCSWSATSAESWIQISNVQGNTVSWAVAASQQLTARTGAINVGSQIFTVTQAAGSCTYSFPATGASIGSGGGNGSVNLTALAGCSWTPVSSNSSWLTIVSPAGATGTATINYHADANPTTSARSAIITAGTASYTITQAGLCGLTLSPVVAGPSFDQNGGSGAVRVTASANNCSWTATSDVPWITISYGFSGTGNGEAGYNVQLNPTTDPRSGALTIGGQTFTVTQAASPSVVCLFTLSPTSANLGSGSNSGAITVTVPSACSWTAVSNNDWISIMYGNSGQGNGTVGWAVPSNPALTSRTGSLTIGTQTFTITQGGASCSYSLSPSNGTLTASGGSGSFTVNAQAGCAWNAASTAPDWLTIASGASGSGTGTVSYTALSNTGSVNRAGTITVATQTFSLTQLGPCVLTFSPASASFYLSGGTGSIVVTASGGSCDRSVTGTPSWITITSQATGSGNGTIGYTVAANTTPAPRSATLFIGGQPFSIDQAGASCSLTLSQPAQFGASGGSGTLNITTGCSWTAASAANWIVLTGASSGTGNGSAGYSVTSNPSGLARAGSITVNGQSFSVSQAGVGCAVTLSMASASVPVSGGNGLIDISTAPDCSWTAAASAGWITFWPQARGTGTDTLNYVVAPNTTPEARTGTVTVNDKVFQINQPGINCEYELSPAATSLPAAGGVYSFQVTSACAWTATIRTPWIKINSATPDGGVSYTVQANPLAASRNGVITVGTQSFNITQVGVLCTATLNSPSANVPGLGGSGKFNVTAPGGCQWIPTSGVSWLSLNWSLVSGSGATFYEVRFQAAVNSAREPRSGTISVGGQTFTVNQGGAEVRIGQSGVLNAASLLPGSVAPGEIVTLTGQGLGPMVAAAYQLTSDGKAIATSLGGTRVLFDGVEAPMLYTSSGQVNAIVPYAIAGKTSTRMQVDFQGTLSDPVTLDVVPTTPALFTADGSGRGQGAILNQNYKLNSASEPAVKDSVVMLFATGEGQTNPEGVDGRLAVLPFPRPKLAVTARIGELDAPVSYAGAAPGLVSGLLQINVRIPAKAPSGSAVPVQILVDGKASQAGVTLAVK